MDSTILGSAPAGPLVDGEHQEDEQETVKDRLCVALKNFGLLDTGSRSGALGQVWMPVLTPSGGVVLQTRGLPYSLAGPGDMLALFRCLSCKYAFSADIKQLSLLGAPGRVFLTKEAETCDDVQQCSINIYLRAKDAQACRVSSTVLLPIFLSAKRDVAVGVFEISQFHGPGVPYGSVFDWAQRHLEGAGLYIPSELSCKTYDMQSHALSIRFFSSGEQMLFSMPSRPGSPMALCEAQERSSDNTVCTPPPDGEAMVAAPEASESGEEQVGGSGGPEGSGTSRSGGKPSAEEDDAWVPPPGASKTVHQKNGMLTRGDLERHFGVGLKEAAVRLGVCNTTLKRACRRHGIMKWPRRELIKAAKRSQQEHGKQQQGAFKQPRTDSPLEPSSSLPAASNSPPVSAAPRNMGFGAAALCPVSRALGGGAADVPITESLRQAHAAISGPPVLSPPGTGWAPANAVSLSSAGWQPEPSFSPHPPPGASKSLFPTSSSFPPHSGAGHIESSAPAFHASANIDSIPSWRPTPAGPVRAASAAPSLSASLPAESLSAGHRISGSFTDLGPLSLLLDDPPHTHQPPLPQHQHQHWPPPLSMAGRLAQNERFGTALGEFFATTFAGEEPPAAVSAPQQPQHQIAVEHWAGLDIPLNFPEVPIFGAANSDFWLP